MDNPLVLSAIAVAILVVGFIIFTKVTQALMKVAFLVIAGVVFLVMFKDKLPV